MIFFSSKIVKYLLVRGCMVSKLDKVHIFGTSVRCSSGRRSGGRLLANDVVATIFISLFFFSPVFFSPSSTFLIEGVLGSKNLISESCLERP